MASRCSGLAMTVSSVPGRFFFICTADVKHFQRAGLVQLVHQDAVDLRVHVVDLAFEDRDLHRRSTTPEGRSIALANQHADDVGRFLQLAIAGAVADLLNRHRRDRTELRSRTRSGSTRRSASAVPSESRSNTPAHPSTAPASPAPGPGRHRARTSPCRRRR